MNEISCDSKEIEDERLKENIFTNFGYCLLLVYELVDLNLPYS